MFRTWLGQLAHRNSRIGIQVRLSADRRKSSFQPNLEALEDRFVLNAATDAINADYLQNQWLGSAVTGYVSVGDGIGTYVEYTNGYIFYSPYSGAHEIGGAIYAKWQSIGGVNFGYPTTDEMSTPDGLGRFNHFAKQQPWGLDTWYAIDWIRATGQAHEVHGLIGQKFFSLGAENFGEATTDETTTPDGAGRYNHFQKQQPWGLDTWYAIDWTPATGAHDVYGLIGQKFFNLGAENLGEAITDEVNFPNGAYNHFQYSPSNNPAVGTSIDWTPAYGAHLVHGYIYFYFVSYGAEQGPYGFATSDEYDPAGLMPATRAQNFLYGEIEYQDDSDPSEPGTDLRILAVYQEKNQVWDIPYNPTTVVFSWWMNRDVDGYLVHFGAVNGSQGPQESAPGGSSGSWTVSIINGQPLTLGTTYLFGIEPYVTAWVFTAYQGWGDPIYYTLT